MNALATALRKTLGSVRLLLLIYGITLVLGLLVALPFYNMIKAEDQNSMAFLNLLSGFDYTVFSDFMQRSERAISPLMSVGRWLGVLYVGLSVFFTGGILLRFAQPATRFNSGLFWQGCTHYAGRFTRLFGVTLIFLLAGAGLWLVVGSLVGTLVSGVFTERGLSWIGVGFFALFAFTATFLLCIGDFAKVLMFREDEHNAFRAFGKAGRLVLRNPGQTYGLYWLLILIGTVLFGIYFLVDITVPMSGWLTILVMFLIQQALIFARVSLKVWWLGTADTIYQIRSNPTSILRTTSVAEHVTNTDIDPPLSTIEA